MSKFAIGLRPEYAEENGRFWAVYLMPQGDWGARVPGGMSDGFKSKLDAVRWVCKEMDKVLAYYVDTK